MGKRMRFFQHLGVVLFGVILGLLAAEVGVRLYFVLVPAPDDSFYVSDPEAVYRMRPSPAGTEGDWFINGFGFRDREHPRQKPEGTYRVLGIGDSFVWGAVSLEENFLRVAERELEKSLGGGLTDVDMVLLGLGGYSPENYVGILRSLGLSLKPDLVVLNMFVGNDIHLIQVRGELFRGRRFFVGSPDPVLHLFRQSRAFVLAEDFFLTRIKAVLLGWKYKEADKKLAQHGPAREAPESEASPAPHVVTRAYVHVQNKRLPVFLRQPSRKIQGLWRKTEEYLEQFDRLCDEANIPWILHIIPTEVQVDGRTRRKVMDILSLSEEQYDFDFPQRRLREFAEQRGIPVLDPLNELRAAHQDEARLYVPNNTHWNSRGNKLAGRLLADFIQQSAGFARSAME